MNEEDLDWALDHAQHTGLRLTFCFCVNANLYIEDRIPDLSLFRGKGCHIVLGTDSYSSNDELKITHEISTIRDRYPSIPLEEILRWATVNGSDALGVSSRWVTGVKIPFAD
jgi:cytosine/adenosine deaminase-related metal-dependent hydrolase